nr:hypothetical protein [Cryptosporangium phraense]
MAGDIADPATAENLVATALQRLGASMHRHRADMAPSTLTAGFVLATASGVILDLDGDQPDEPWTELTDLVRTAFAEGLGADALSSAPSPPHLTLGYATGTDDSGIMQPRLRRQVRPSHAPLTIHAVDLVDVTQDDKNSEYRWGTICRVFLGSDESRARRPD